MKLLHASHALHTDLGHQHETVAVGLTVFKHYVQMYKKKTWKWEDKLHRKTTALRNTES